MRRTTLVGVLLVGKGIDAVSTVVVERLLPEVTPRWYPPSFRAAVYLVSACWFATLGVRNLLLVL